MNYYLKIFLFFSISILINLLSICYTFSQVCVGSWALQRPLTQECVTGQWIGWQNVGSPAGCPINPIYSGVQINTFTFNEPKSLFSIDFRGFDGQAFCPRIEIKINGIYFPLTAANIFDLPFGTTCTGSFSRLTITPEGYITVNTSSGPSTQGRIIISNVNASSVSLSTNDGSGTVFSDPFNCLPVVPINFISFNAQITLQCEVLLDWKTGIEFNVKNIDIESSENGISYRKVAEVLPKGSNSSYSFNVPNNSNAYFRLKVNDLDGYFEYSETKFVKSSCSDILYSIIPTPTSGEFQIKGLKKSDYLLITDMLGRDLLRFVAPSNKIINIQSLPHGFYVLQVFNTGNRKGSLKLIRD